MWEASMWKHIGEQYMLLERLKHKEMIPVLEERIKQCIIKVNLGEYQQYQKGENKMVKVQAIIDFTYKKYDKIQNLNSLDKIEKGKIFKEDIFEVEDKEALYLTGENKNKIVAVKVLEVIPEIKEKEEITTKAKNKNNKKKEEIGRAHV